ncbi:MAG: glycosyltransferase [Actinomycetota bacterium]|nr:glycosyltransferase [Actinomycetota bacterium]
MPIKPVPIDRLESLIGTERQDVARRLAEAATRELGESTVWNVNSTAAGGGVAEMLAVLVAYAEGAGVKCKWLVTDGDPEFFAITKRIHNLLHGSQVRGELGQAEHDHYDEVTAGNAAQLREHVKPGDIVILHDPQTAGLSETVADIGAQAIWRCHVGRDEFNDEMTRAWDFLRPYVERAQATVFSRAEYAPDWVDREHMAVIPPSIDPFSPKNQDLELEQARALLIAAGVLSGRSGGEPEFVRGDGSSATLDSAAELVGDPPDVDTPLVVQVSRWDRLKDHEGVLRGFAEHVLGTSEGDKAHLLLVGPSVAGVADDPEGQEVLDECTKAWHDLPEDQRARISLVSLPMDDGEENAALVNAVQRQAAVMVQKSLVEGFGLTVAEAMWKSRPVVASAVGGILDQITDGEQGLLLEDPSDLAAFGAAVRRLLGDLDEADRMGSAARERVNERFLPDRQLAQWYELLGSLRD